MFPEIPQLPADPGAALAQVPLTVPAPAVNPVSEITPKDRDFFNDVIRMAKKQALKDSKTVKYFVDLFKYGQFKEGEGASANFTFSDVSLLMSVLYARDPNIVVTAQSAGDLPAFDMLVQMGIFPDSAMAHEKYGDVLEKVESFIWRDSRTATQINAALFNAIVTGMGIVKISFDDDRGFSRVDTLSRDEVFIDPSARFELGQARYVAQVCVMTVEEAQAFFTKIGSQAQITKGNYKLSEGESLMAEMAKKNEPEDLEERYFRFYEIWFKGADGSRKVYYRDYDEELKWLHVRDWPYVMDKDAFPYSVLVFNQQYQQLLDAFTDLCTVNGLRIAYENIVEFYRQHVFKGIATKLVYDKSAFPDGDFEAFLDGDDLKSIPAVLGGRKVDDIIQKINLTEDAGNIIELASSLKSIKDEIFGIADIQRGASAKKYTAKQAGIQEDWGRQRIDRRQAILDAFLEDILLKRTQIDLLLASSDKIARIVGPEGQLLWDMFDGDMDELRCLYSITVAAGSTGEGAKAQKIESMERCFKLLDAVNATQPMPVFDTVRLAEELLKLYDLPHPERFILGPVQPKDMGQPPMPGGPVPSDNGSADQGANGVGPGGNSPPQTSPGESEPGAPMMNQ
jgi:hypothetical protein